MQDKVNYNEMIRLAGPKERQRLADRFPGLINAEAPPSIFIASERFAIGPPLGFGFLHHGGSLPNDTGQVHLAVRAERRGEGVGTALLKRVIDAAKIRKLQNLETLSPIEQENPAGGFLRRFGFESIGAVTELKADASALLAAVEPVYRHLVQRRKIPPGVELLPIESSRVDEVRRLIADCLPRSANRLETDLRSFQGTASRVLQVNGELYGEMLVKPGDDAVIWHSIAVSPSRRNTWASTYLKHGVFVNLAADGPTAVRFFASELYSRDTYRLAERAAAEVVGSADHFRLALHKPAQPA